MSSIENKALKDIVDLYSLLRERKDQTPEMLDITDVLLEVSKKLKTTKNPEALINRLVQYIRSTAIKGKIYFPPEEEKIVISLSAIGKKAGLIGLYMADFSDKTQFYTWTEQVPRH